MNRPSLSRRSLVLGAAAGAVAAGRWGSAGATGDSLVWSTWPTDGIAGFGDAFARGTGIEVKTSYIENDDAQFASLKAGFASDWDVVTPSINGITRYIAANLLRPLDLTRIPNSARMYAAFRSSSKIVGADATIRGLPFLFGINPIIYRADVISQPPDYAALFDARYKGKLAMRDYALEAVAIAGLYLGVPAERVFRMSDVELAEARKALRLQQPLLRATWRNIGDLTDLFASGDVTCAFGWRTPYDELKDKMKMAMAMPEQGIMGWCDCCAIPATLPEAKVAAAYQFIDYLLGSEYGMFIAEHGNYATTSAAQRDRLSPAKRAEIFIDDIAQMRNILWPSTPPNYATWESLWNEVKAA